MRKSKWDRFLGTFSKFPKWSKILLLFFAVTAVTVKKAYALVGAAIIGGATLISIFVPGVRNWLLGGLSSAALGIVEGLSSLIGWVLGFVAGAVYFIANALIEFAFNLNDALINPGSPIVEEGLSLTLAVVNMGIIVAIVVIAYAIMTRAEWLVVGRKAIPKFIATALLIQFSYFIATGLILTPINEISKNIYAATSFNNDSFRNVFQPQVDLRDSLVAIHNTEYQSAGGENQDVFIEYALFQDRILAPVINNLLLMTERGELPCLPEQGTAVCPGATYSTASSFKVDMSAFKDGVDQATRQAVITEMVREVDQWIKNDIGNQNNDFLADQLAKALDEGDRTYVDAINAPDSSQSDGHSERVFLKTYFFEPIRRAYIGDYEWLTSPEPFTAGSTTIELPSLISDKNLSEGLPRYNCDVVGGENALEQDHASPERTPECDGVATLVPGDLDKGVEMAIILVDIVFKVLYVFLGSFALIAFGVLLIIRYVALSILIILFPFAWVGWIFPKLESLGVSIWKKWWQEFLRWALFAPVAFFFLWLAVNAATQIGNITGYGEQGYGDIAYMGIAMGNAITVLGLLIAGLYASNKMGVKGADFFYNGVKGFGKDASKWIKDKTYGRVVGYGKSKARGVKDAAVSRARGARDRVDTAIKARLGGVPGLRGVAGRARSGIATRDTETREKLEKEVANLTDGALRSILKSKYSSRRRTAVALAQLLKRGRATSADVIQGLPSVRGTGLGRKEILNTRPDLAPSFDDAITPSSSHDEIKVSIGRQVRNISQGDIANLSVDAVSVADANDKKVATVINLSNRQLGKIGRDGSPELISEIKDSITKINKDTKPLSFQEATSLKRVENHIRGDVNWQ